MKIIRESNQNVINALGINNMDTTKKHRLLKYLIIEDIDDGKLIHNELTGGFVWMPNIQFDNIYVEDRSIDYINWLWGNYFLVNEDFDEESEQERLKKHFRPNPEEGWYLHSGNLSDYTIFTTMGCNARCGYCYEKGRPQLPMKSETAKRVGEYIIRTAVKNGKHIQLRWFGGEPLVNENVIDIICKMVQEAGFSYDSSFTSNGFLFKKEKLEKYKNLWHLTSVQITLDGTEEKYNKIKNFKNVKGKNPYQIVNDNIKMLLDNNVHVAIRMNMDLNNAENIKLLVEELHERYGNYKHVSPYCYPIFEYDNLRTPEENEKLFTYLKEVDEQLLKYFFGRSGHPYGVRSTHCMIDNGHSVVIGTQGDIGLCEHYSEDNFWGHIDKPEMKDLDMIKSFQEYVEIEDICKTCPILPTCLRPKKCEDIQRCNVWKKEWHVRQAHTEILNIYKMYKNDIANSKNPVIKCWNHSYSYPVLTNNCETTDETPVEPEKKGLSKLWENILILIGLK